MSARGLEALSADVRELFASCDVVFANLECTLEGKETILPEPIVLATEKQIRSLKDTGINVVTVGNNHTFDSLDEGFQKLRGVLAELTLPFCGAGFNLKEALSPVIMDVKGITIAFLGVVDESSGPFRYAGESTSGVAPLITEQVCRIINNLKNDVDHVVVSPHWGMERFRVPSLDQVEQAKAFVDAGASMVLGHHPHVIQGMELYLGAPIAYSLGNFLANDVHWRNGDFLTWNRFERTGVILVAECNSTNVLNVKQIPVFDDGVMVSIDTSGQGGQFLRNVNSLLASGITPERYRREKFYVQVVKPILAQLKWSKLKNIRPGHFFKLMNLFFR
jgi:poly-gamma-glutamate capsule biosynthesis protein CapA/YwtB (metallophosphatase superfamily)